MAEYSALPSTCCWHTSHCSRICLNSSWPPTAPCKHTRPHMHTLTHMPRSQLKEFMTPPPTPLSVDNRLILPPSLFFLLRSLSLSLFLYVCVCVWQLPNWAFSSRLSACLSSLSSSLGQGCWRMAVDYRWGHSDLPDLAAQPRGGRGCVGVRWWGGQAEH